MSAAPDEQAGSAVHGVGAPAAGFVAALAGLPRMTAGRLRSLLAVGDAEEAYAIAAGRARPSGKLAALLGRDPELARVWRAAARERTPEACWAACARAGIDVVVPGMSAFPPQLLDDPACPAVLFARGDPTVLDARRVGIIGTRNATRRGRQTAARFGHELAAAGVVVVSGLARGIDGAAHRGALAAGAAPPVGVVGNGLDRPYPAEHRRLWDDVAARGALLSEWPPGTPPDAFRFPLRNRILAALVEVLVVVESRERGGSLITVKEAADRDVVLMAVPGSVDSAASAGTNRLLGDGVETANEPDDVLVALGLDRRRAGRARFDARPRPRGQAAQLVEFCRDAARSVDQVVAEFSLGLAEAAMALARLERDGWLHETGGWFETVDEWGELA